MAEHSATPWQLCHHLASAEKDASCKCGYRGGIWGDDGEILVCEMRNCDLHEGHDMTPVGDRATQLANAAFIIKAVNNHDRLVLALEEEREYWAGEIACAMLRGDPSDDAQDRVDRISRVLDVLIAPRHT